MPAQSETELIQDRHWPKECLMKSGILPSVHLVEQSSLHVTKARLYSIVIR